MFTKVTNPRARAYAHPLKSLHHPLRMPLFLPPPLPIGSRVRLHRARAVEKNNNRRTMCAAGVHQTTQHVKSKQERI